MEPTRIETWKPIRGYEGYYEVSDRGRVRSLDRTITNSLGRRQSFRGCMMSFLTSSTGYFTVGLKRDGSVKRFLVHRLVADAFCGSLRAGDVVRHLDGNKTNNHADNLAWGTVSDNIHDQVRHGRHNYARRTHCPRGHALEMPNLIRATWVKRRYRSCLACQRARDVARHRPVDLQAESDSQHRRIMAELLPDGGVW